MKGSWRGLMDLFGLFCIASVLISLKTLVTVLHQYSCPLSSAQKRRDILNLIRSISSADVVSELKVGSVHISLDGRCAA